MSGEIIISLIGMFISAGAFVNAFSFPGGTADGVPGAGVFPQALCVVIFVLNVVVIAKALKNRVKKEKLSKEEKGKLVQIAIIVILAVLFLIFWGKVHFVVLCSLLLIGVGVVLKQNLKTFIPGAIVSSVIVYVVFQQLLNVMLS